ncbi:unnamed protein product [Staurois parvus]|uniref:Uncharacterized protein n=1 Tax=Staurois parvus TaxID=386267 RepID=A0ABN9HG87_9NEOB|nr:unnamed protein product [Staurois parvus]
MISVAPAVPRASSHQCHINATYKCLPVHSNATYQCPSELPFSVTHQCQSVPSISVHQCSLSVPITAVSLAHISEGEKSLLYKIL